MTPLQEHLYQYIMEDRFTALLADEAYQAVRQQASVAEAQLLAAPPEQAEEQELLITSIVETLCSLDKVEQVRLLVEGEALTAYGGLDLSGPLLPAKPKDGFAGTPS